MKSTLTATKPKSPPPRGSKNLPTKLKTPNAETLVREAFDNIGLLIGSAAGCHRLDDDLVWTLTQRLDRIRIRFFRSWKGLAPDQAVPPSVASPPRVHPAVEEFLLRNQARLGE